MENTPDDIDDGDKEKQIRLFIKLHPPDMMIRTFINMIGLCTNENRFFNEIADTIPSHLSVKTYCSMNLNSSTSNSRGFICMWDKYIVIISRYVYG